MGGLKDKRVGVGCDWVWLSVARKFDAKEAEVIFFMQKYGTENG